MAILQQHDHRVTKNSHWPQIEIFYDEPDRGSFVQEYA